jgi:hypothetical protein
MFDNPKCLHLLGYGLIWGARMLTVTRNHQELIVTRDLVRHDIGKRGNNLLLGRKVRTLLKLEVTNGT